MNILNNKKILIIICGGISAYKTLEVIRKLKKEGSTVKTILTKSAEKFVTRLSVASLSQEKVYTDLFNYNNESEMDHISLSRWADLILVIPTTANKIAKLSNGIADDLASTVLLASNKKIFLAPAMNVRMWEHPKNKENLFKLKELGYKLIGPSIGEMACGEYGEGKMSEPGKIIEIVRQYFSNIKKNKKFKALVTAGPTIEQIDPVRFISNLSSGKQGYEVARAFIENGFETTLISGPSNLKAPDNINLVKVLSAEEMFNETLKNLPADVAIFNAAVSDYKVKNYSMNKIKKSDGLKIELEKNKDILEHVSKHNSLRPKLVIGFAAETNDISRNADKKLKEKNCDWIISNDISKSEIGFNSEFNEVCIHSVDNNEIIPKSRKSLIADEIVSRVISKLEMDYGQSSN